MRYRQFNTVFNQQVPLLSSASMLSKEWSTLFPGPFPAVINHINLKVGSVRHHFTGTPVGLGAWGLDRLKPNNHWLYSSGFAVCAIDTLFTRGVQKQTKFSNFPKTFLWVNLGSECRGLFTLRNCVNRRCPQAETRAGQWTKGYRRLLGLSGRAMGYF